MIWVWVAGLVLATILVGYGAAAFGRPPRDNTPPPSWMPWDLASDTGERPYVGHRRAPRYEDVIGVEGTGPAEGLNLRPATERPPMHPRTFDLEPGNREEKTQRIKWTPPPPPEWPLRPPIQ